MSECMNCEIEGREGVSECMQCGVEGRDGVAVGDESWCCGGLLAEDGPMRKGDWRVEAPSEETSLLSMVDCSSKCSLTSSS